MSNKLTTKEFGEKIGVSYRRVVQMIQRGELEADKFGHAYMIDEKHVESVKNRPETRGRKRKETAKKITKVRAAA